RGTFRENKPRAPHFKRSACFFRRSLPFRKHADRLEHSQHEFGERCFGRACDDCRCIPVGDLFCCPADGIQACRACCSEGCCLACCSRMDRDVRCCRMCWELKCCPWGDLATTKKGLVVWLRDIDVAV